MKPSSNTDSYTLFNSLVRKKKVLEGVLIGVMDEGFCRRELQVLPARNRLGQLSSEGDLEGCQEKGRASGDY